MTEFKQVIGRGTRVRDDYCHWAARKPATDEGRLTGHFETKEDLHHWTKFTEYPRTVIHWPRDQRRSHNRAGHTVLRDQIAARLRWLTKLETRLSFRLGFPPADKLQSATIAARDLHVARTHASCRCPAAGSRPVNATSASRPYSVETAAMCLQTCRRSAHTSSTQRCSRRPRSKCFGRSSGTITGGRVTRSALSSMPPNACNIEVADIVCNALGKWGASSRSSSPSPVCCTTTHSN